MRIEKKQQKSKKTMLILAALLLLVIVGTSLLIGFRNGFTIFGWSPFPSSEQTGSYKPATEEEINDGNNTKSSTIKGSGDTTNTKPDKQQDSGDNENNSQQESVNLIITAANQASQSLQVRTLISKVTSDGKCTLTLSKDTSKITKSSNVQALSSSSTCQGFDVPLSELSPGNWLLSVTYKDSDSTGSATQQITVE